MADKVIEQGLSRRSFLKTGVAAGALAGVGQLAEATEQKKATDLVVLGRSGIKTSRLAFGTGSHGGRVQQKLGQDSFNRLVRHAYDSGVRFFETSETYGSSAQMLGIALKGLPRESYTLMHKVTTRDNPEVDPHVRLEELRKVVQADYLDIMLLHVQHTSTWVEDSKRWQDAIDEAHHRQIIRARGASIHGLPALRRVAAHDWMQVALVRTNHTGQVMDAENWDARVSDNFDDVVHNIQAAKKAGIGLIGMKLCAEGAFEREDRQKSVRFAFRTAGVDSVTMGFKSPQEIDEALDNINLALA
jgi:predicted aldo/keto reductase-like oxidoreductase